MRHTLAPKKHLGQHFLADDNIARKIAAAIAPAASDVMVEVGPGEGALTRFLAGNVKQLYALELDDRAGDVLAEKFPDGMTLIRGDALTVNLRELSTANGALLRIVGNIPYQITSPLLFHLFDHADIVHDALFMIQREVADRIVAPPGSKNYGILSVMSQFYGTPKRLFTVAPGSFFPPPSVTSAVISIPFHHPMRANVNPALFRRIVKATFGKRRKVLSNSLREMNLSTESIDAIGTTVDLSRRPEQLSVAEFELLTKAVATIGGAQ